MNEEGLSGHQRKKLAQQRRMRSRISCDVLLARLYLYHGRDHGGVEYRVVDLEPPAPPPEQLSANDVDVPSPQRDPDPELDAPRPKVSMIIRDCADYYGIGRDDLISSRRAASSIRPRHMAMFLCKEMTLNSLAEIGRRFGGRDHTTVRHAVIKMEKRIVDTPEIGAEFSAIKAMIQQKTIRAAAMHAQGAQCNSAQTAAA